MSLNAFDNQLRPIDRIEFEILQNVQVKRMSVFGENSLGVEVYDLYESGSPKAGSLIDTRFGPNNSTDICATCGFQTIHCVGHSAHITLAEPFWHRFYMDYVKKILTCICLKCSKILLYKNEEEIKTQLLNKPPKERLSRLKKIVQSVNYCQRPNYGCGTMVTKIKKEKKAQLGTVYLVSEANLQNIPTEEGTIVEKKKPPRQVLTPEIVYDILKNISDEDCNLMGLMVRPENMILIHFLVPPTAIRPSAKADWSASSRMEDDLTMIMVDIVRSNGKLRKLKENPSQHAKTINDNRTLLSCFIMSWLDNGACSVGSDKSKIRKSLSARIKGKEGRIRTNLMGKRVNYSGRTVITPDPTLDINQLGLPIKIARNLTFPETVTPYNIEHLQLLVRNSRSVYPGANFVRRRLRNEEEVTFDLRFSKEKVILQYGDIVDRQLVNDDYVLLNRQPTLHKLSMMGHKVKVILNDDLETFRLCPNVTTPYNADFDGDEMNIHVPQSIQTAIELSERGDAAKQIISPRSGSPAIGTVQDVLIGAYNITNPNTVLNWKVAMNILTHTNLDFDDLIKLTKEDIKGSDLFSFIIPQGINLNRQNVKITNGHLEQGRIEKSLIGPSAGGIIHYIWDRYGYKETASFLSNVQRLANNYNFYKGFTAGIGDVYINREFETEIDLVVQRKIIEICNRITLLENNPNLLDIETFEQSINSSSNAVLSDCSSMTLEKISDANNFKTMQKSGSKGSPENIGQMIAAICQQSVEGVRAKKKCNKRTLPYFAQNDDTPNARGFSRSCFARGQTPTEFIFQNQSARVGIMDTAIKTAESGYIQRKLIKALEDVMINYDSTVRSANYVILQFIYGDDGLNPTKQYKHNLAILTMSNDEIKEKFIGNVMKNKAQSDKLLAKIIKLRDIIRYNKVKQSAEYLIFDSSSMLAIDLNRLVLDAKNAKDKGTNKEKLEAEYVVEKINEILKYENTKVTCMTKETNKKGSIKYGDEKASKLILKLSLYNYISPRLCIEEYGFNKHQFDTLCDEIINSFNKSMVEPGEMVGILAAQSIGEPTTQLTLNTFHFTGIGSKSAQSLGVPRMKELLNCTSNMKVSYMNIYIDKEYVKNQAIVNKISSHIKYTNMKHITDETNIYYDPNMYEKGSIMDRDNVKNIFHKINATKLSCQSDITSLPWLIRIVLNREKLLEKNITLMDIKTKFCNSWERRNKNLKSIKGQEKIVFNRVTQCAILSNNENDSVPIIHIRLDLSVVDFNTLKQFVDIFVENFELKGIANVQDVSSVENKMLVSFEKETGKMIKEENIIITTDGVNLSALKYLNGIDNHKTITNDIVEIYNKFGIEAARNKIINELDVVLRSSNISFHHLSVLADLMTNTGILTSVDRHGLHKLNIDPLAKASFEKPVEQLINAAVFNEVDHLNSVSSRIMTGLAIKGGTGLSNVLLDADLLESSEYDVDTMYKYKKSAKELTYDAIINDVINNDAEDKDVYIPY